MVFTCNTHYDESHECLSLYFSNSVCLSVCVSVSFYECSKVFRGRYLYNFLCDWCCVKMYSSTCLGLRKLPFAEWDGVWVLHLSIETVFIWTILGFFLLTKIANWRIYLRKWRKFWHFCLLHCSTWTKWSIV